MSDNSKILTGIVVGGVAAFAALKAAAAFAPATEKSKMGVPTLGYHKIRGLGAPLRMMLYYASQDFINVGFGADFREEWFGKEKKVLREKNACINLPYIIDGDEVITQTNTCLIHLGARLGLDETTRAAAARNHTVLDQTMDFRNDLMKIVYPFAGVCKTKEEFPEAAKAHLSGSADTHLTKLNGFCEGPFMGGAAPQSGDFALFEMLDQHLIICQSLGLEDVLEKFPKLKTLHAAMKAEPRLASYFASDCYSKWAHNNAIFTHFIGQGEGFEYGDTITEKVTF